MKRIMKVRVVGPPSLHQILHHTSIIILSSANTITQFSLSLLFLLVVLVVCVGQYRKQLVDSERKRQSNFAK